MCNIDLLESVQRAKRWMSVAAAMKSSDSCDQYEESFSANTSRTGMLPKNRAKIVDG